MPVFFRSLAVMFKAGITLDRALTLLSQRSDDKALAAVCRDLACEVAAGLPFSQTLMLHPRAFTALQARLIQVGERTGNLDKILNRLANYEEKRRGMATRVQSALAYPALLFVLAVLMLVILPPYLQQGLFQIIATSGVQPPLLTRLVMAFSDFVRSPLFYVLGLAVAGGCYTFLPGFLARPGVRRRLSTWMLRLPLLGKTYRTLGASRFTRAMEVQLEAGEMPLPALQLAAETTDNPVLLERIPRAIELLRAGATLSQALESTGFFPPTVVHMVRAGEETGEIPRMMGRAADLTEGDLDLTLDTLTALLEPLVMLVMGVLAGIVVLATLLPMLTLLRTL
jgi:general secretion pathway protein F